MLAGTWEFWSKLLRSREIPSQRGGEEPDKLNEVILAYNAEGTWNRTFLLFEYTRTGSDKLRWHTKWAVGLVPVGGSRSTTKALDKFRN